MYPELKIIKNGYHSSEIVDFLHFTKQKQRTQVNLFYITHDDGAKHY